jgi:hypothetical protein
MKKKLSTRKKWSRILIILWDCLVILTAIVIELYNYHGEP